MLVFVLLVLVWYWCFYAGYVSAHVGLLHNLTASHEDLALLLREVLQRFCRSQVLLPELLVEILPRIVLLLRKL